MEVVNDVGQGALMNEISDRRLKENEVIFRNANKSIQEFIEEVQGTDTQKMIPFYCECSHLDCRERISMTPKMYKELHGNYKQFTIIKEHVIPQIERIVDHKDNLAVVEKNGKMPMPKDINLALKSIRI